MSRGTLGLVLSGGGARGAFHIGVHECLLGDPRFHRGPAILSGTSSGAINAALIAAGKNPEEMMAFWCGLAEDPPVAASEAFVRGALAATGGSSARPHQNSIIWSGVFPAAMSAALMAPDDVPESTAGPRWKRGSPRSISYTPMWNAPRAPPPERTRPSALRLTARTPPGTS